MSELRTANKCKECAKSAEECSCENPIFEECAPPSIHFIYGLVKEMKELIALIPPDTTQNVVKRHILRTRAKMLDTLLIDTKRDAYFNKIAHQKESKMLEIALQEEQNAI